MEVVLTLDSRDLSSMTDDEMYGRGWSFHETFDELGDNQGTLAMIKIPQWIKNKQLDGNASNLQYIPKFSYKYLFVAFWGFRRKDRKVYDFYYFYSFLVLPFSPKLPIVTCFKHTLY